MRLLHTADLYFKEFVEPPREDYGYGTNSEYAILSHRWREGEATFRDFLQGWAWTDHRQGVQKIMTFCDVAKENGYKWAWVDTCCIDKTSSAELSEAINSMWNWYKNGHCFVYLDDISTTLELENELPKCAWFKRGWTLQELLAPHEMTFFDKDWTRFGTKQEHSSLLSKITSIPEMFLLEPWPKVSWRASTAMKMSWASDRRVTKGEDVAYCMLGLFDVSMPLLYGEGDVKAFVRLQLEILRKSADESIFAWTGDWAYRGMIATTPKAFQSSGRVFSFSFRSHQRLPYIMTNQGLELRLPLGTIANMTPDIEKSFKPYQQNQIANPEYLQHDVRFYLACGEVDDKRPQLPTMTTTGDCDLWWDRAEENVICISLTRYRNHWRRSWTKTLETSKGLRPFKESNKSLTFYIPQDGL